MSQPVDVATTSQSEVRCDGCGSRDRKTSAYVLCDRCLCANTERMAAVKARFGEPVDWADVKKYGLYDRHGRPIATVMRIDRMPPRVFAGGGMSTGPMHVMYTTSTMGDERKSIVMIEAKELLP